MFFSTIKTEPIPERVLSLCRALASKGPLKTTDLRTMMEPPNMNIESSTSYYAPVLETAKELKLVEEKNDAMLSFIGDKSVIKNLSTFRTYCNSVVFSDKSTDFYKIISCFLNANDSWLQYGSITTSNDIIRIVNAETDIASLKLQKDVMLGVRFWINFLGFGYFQESSKVFLPNAYTALKDFIKLGQLEIGKQYTVEEFLDGLHPCSAVALTGSREKRTLNFAISNALRFMHDNNEIKLDFIHDSKKEWHLFQNEEHEFTSLITHITLRERIK